MSTKYERELKKILEKNDFFVIRSAGSKSIDLLAVKKGPEVFFIEEKSTHGDKYRVSKNKESKDQYDLNRKLAKKYGIFVIYAVRYISRRAGKEWEIYSPIYEMDDYPIFRREEGTPLMDWLNNL